MSATVRSAKRSRGGAMLELVLFAPWIFLLFIGALDWGFYASALVSLQAGVRSAALYTSGGSSVANDSTTACAIIRAEIAKLPNASTGITACSATSITGPDSATATQVSATYQSISLLPMPGLLASQFTVTRVVTMRVRT